MLACKHSRKVSTMSDLFRSNINASKARKFNAKMYAKFGLGDKVIPEGAISTS